MQRAVVIGVRRAEPLVEAVAGGQELRVMAEVPLAVNGGRVALFLAEFAQQRFLSRDADGAGVVERPAEADAVRIAAGEQRRPRRGANRLGDVEAREPRALASQ